jgi:chorismate dehydratase
MAEIASPSTKPISIGAVSYLNSKPLIAGLAEALPDARLTCDVPSRLADGLMRGRYDLALVPIVEHLRHPETILVSNACVACRGPVWSVRLYFRTPASKVRRLALDEGSRTSAALAQVLLWNLHGVRPELSPLPLGSGVEESTADAMLLIGDRAMRVPSGEFVEVWDLGDRWCRWAELPFVFAAWIARPGLEAELPRIAKVLEDVRDSGLARLGSIAKTEAPKLGIEQRIAESYLTHNLHFRLGPDELAGMQRFAGLCQSMGLVGESLPCFEQMVLAS